MINRISLVLPSTEAQQPKSGMTATASATAMVASGGTPPSGAPNGMQALVAAGVAIFGVVTALFPTAPLVAVVTTAIPQLKIALPIVLTSVGLIWAAVAHPPAFLRRDSVS